MVVSWHRTIHEYIDCLEYHELPLWVVYHHHQFHHICMVLPHNNLKRDLALF